MARSKFPESSFTKPVSSSSRTILTLQCVTSNPSSTYRSVWFFQKRDAAKKIWKEAKVRLSNGKKSNELIGRKFRRTDVPIPPPRSTIGNQFAGMTARFFNAIQEGRCMIYTRRWFGREPCNETLATRLLAEGTGASLISIRDVSTGDSQFIQRADSNHRSDSLTRVTARPRYSFRLTTTLFFWYYEDLNDTQKQICLQVRSKQFYWVVWRIT